MSNLLHSVLQSRLANTEEGLQDWEAVESDDELVQVHSGAQTGTVTPVEPKDPEVAAPLGLSKLRYEAKRKASTDPLRAFGNEVAQHIFLQLPPRTLLSCSEVSKRWRRSATLNYCWFQHHQSSLLGQEASPTLPAWGSGGAKWTRRQSKTDWKTAFLKQRKMEARDAQRAESLPGSGTVTPSRTQKMVDAGLVTTQMARRQQWDEQEQPATKEEMREYYKSATNKGGKVKGKREKGGVKTGLQGDGGLWD
ncbi:hypothetical protein ACQY0O_001818 [Thecaphora frezii]